ncbi:hypothetical protein [Actinoplanes teichomyceticus]|uniref:pPIWI-RE three-gene island domain-containing protein n=1 Tax=Actinoplanes teichomyceticus TaxID=1867 RepID=A0A561VH11_ACTTI|nr:hypothetical protein [Actinoplanes teichomyceticus]TWG10898.1 hypothetical protein FHX34_107396 [Actinoplanes teichomyceticus]GIF12480.1 hypothetical protein Ate01nite_25120 [Actinoplanes teichomyceticus]
MRDAETVLGPVLDAMAETAAVPLMTRAELILLCEVELGLYLQRRLMRDAPVSDTWPLFSGYPFAQAWGVADADRALQAARYTLWPYTRWVAWDELLDQYSDFDPRLRLFDVTDRAAPAVLQAPLIAPGRIEQYDQLIREAPPFKQLPLAPAQPGRHRFQVGQTEVVVTLPEHGSIPPRPHDLALAPMGTGAPLTFNRTDLEATATAMDLREPQDWAGRLRRTGFVTESDERFRGSDTFSVNRIQHLLGIVGAGKSTIRDIITIHLVQKHDMRVTVVVGDVAEVLKLVDLYNRHLGTGVAAPLIGATGREEHAQRLHRRLASRGQTSLLAHDNPGFQYLSTSCVINTLLSPELDPLPYGEAPCSTLYAARPNVRRVGAESWVRNRAACPYWEECPRQHSARALVEARIWVTTPAGLIQASVPRPQNGERVRYLELACRRSDLVIVDEADRVQMQLDQMFAPSVTLVGTAGSGRSLLDELNTHRIQELAAAGRRQLSVRAVADWTAAVNVVVTATDRLYAMLVGSREMRDWVRIGHFNAWSLQLRLIDEQYPDKDQGLEARRRLTEMLDAFRDDPLGDERDPGTDTDLIRLAEELLHTGRPRRTRARLRSLVTELFRLGSERTGAESPSAEGDDDDSVSLREQLDRVCPRFEFTLLLAVLERKLSMVNAMWPRVQAVLRLEFNQMYRGPDDYRPIIPESPMGNVVGFQFVVNGPDRDGVQTGELRFFRCIGVGRELLRAMPGLAEIDGRPPTNVLLMSGSSWAGTSSRYHIAVPVGVILRPRPDPAVTDLGASPSDPKRLDITDTAMRFEFFHVGNEPLAVSGSRPGEREQVLRRIARRLGESMDGEESRLEQELGSLPEERRRILLLVGSYHETAVVADELHQISERWRNGKVVRLVPDHDDTMEIDPEDDRHAPILRRGDVDVLEQSGADILVAPLLAVERGHNILNVHQQAAIGTAYFLVRPNPRPDDIFLAVHAVNDWIVRSMDKGAFTSWVRGEDSLDRAARKVRQLARSKWYAVLARSLAWSRLREDRDSVTWDLLVLMWQVIGRLVRGDVPARVVFVDAAFAPGRAGIPGQPDTRETSLLSSVLHVLRPYFTEGSTVSDHDRFIVDSLYRPLWLALSRCIEQSPERN